MANAAAGSDDPDGPRRRGRIEREFGVPIAGEILPPEQWTQTALKKWPDGPLEWSALFGRSAPVVVDLGCGNGRFLLGSSVWRPQIDHLGVDSLPLVIRYATRRGNHRGLANLRFAVGDAAEVVKHRLPPASVDEIHCYHPQPYYDPAAIHRRLITPKFLAMVHRALKLEGKFFLQTDNPGYWRYMARIAPMFFIIYEQGGPWPDAPKGRTRREILALRRRLPVFRCWGSPLANLDAAKALTLAESLPPPIFDADRRLRQLDESEREE